MKERMKTKKGDGGIDECAKNTHKCHQLQLCCLVMRAFAYAHAILYVHTPTGSVCVCAWRRIIDVAGLIPHEYMIPGILGCFPS